jgi:hypothetical protein
MPRSSTRRLRSFAFGYCVLLALLTLAEMGARFAVAPSFALGLIPRMFFLPSLVEETTGRHVRVLA